MDWYVILKYIHVLFVIVWLGGGFCLVVLGVRADRANNEADFAAILKNVVYMSGHVFIPSALIALVFGLLIFFIYGLYDFLWTYIGLLGFAATFALGALVLGPRSDKVTKEIAASGITPDTLRQGREILQLAKFDFVVLFVVVADMVMKPGWSNWILLVIMVVVIAAGAYFFIGNLLKPMIDQVMPKAKT
ncbi:MAG TPA: DUF2269 family protein [Bauldia sp.]|nr:DUF2269 family protein [Bauldia sp.]